MSEPEYTQRDRILRALARGDGQMMNGFDLGQTAETMYGGQADQIEYLIAAEQRAALKGVARELEAVARLLRGEPGDRARRSEISACIDLIRAYGQGLTQEAQARYNERRAAATVPLDQVCQHEECCNYYLCAHPKCCGYRGRIEAEHAEVAEASINRTPPEERCEACVAEAFAITSASDPHTCALRLPPDSTPAGLRVEIHEGIGSVTTCKVWRDGVLVFDGVDRSVLLSTPPAGGAS